MNLQETQIKVYEFVTEVLKSQETKKDPAMITSIAELIKSVRFD